MEDMVGSTGFSGGVRTESCGLGAGLGVASRMVTGSTWIVSGSEVGSDD